MSRAAAGPKTAVVFGAGGGIGTALCRILHERGTQVVAIGRNAARLSTAVGTTAHLLLQADATSSEDVDRAFSSVVERYGPPDAVTNLVGAMLLKPAHLTTDVEWRTQVGTHLDSSFAILRAATRTMLATGGSIAFVSSAAARIGLAHHEAMAAVKAGIEGLALSAAASYASRGIRVNVVAPGMVETQLTARLRSSAASAKAAALLHPLGRIGKPEEIAEGLAWLLGPSSAWVSGVVLPIDGGLARLRPPIMQGEAR